MISTPFTLLYASLNAFLYLFLSFYVVFVRINEKIELGDANHPKMLQVIRVHANAAEYIPLVLLLMFVLEVNHAGPILLNLIGASLLLGRILHAYGLNKSRGPSFGRFLGTNLTWISLLISAVACLYFYLKK